MMKASHSLREHAEGAASLMLSEAPNGFSLILRDSQAPIKNHEI